VSASVLPAFTVAGTAADERAPEVARGEEAGEWAVAWQVQSAGNGWDLGWVTVDAQGGAVGEAETLSAAPNAQEGVALACDSERSRYLAVWQDGRNAATSLDVYALSPKWAT
jgi:hypothetical protein